MVRTLVFCSFLLVPMFTGCDPDDLALAERNTPSRVDRALKVDAGAPDEASQVRFVLLSGALDEAPVDIQALTADPPAGVKVLGRVLLGGVDATRPASFREVDEGHYTVCAAVGLASGSRVAQEAKMAAAYVAVGGGTELDAEKLEAAAKLLEADPGFVAPKIDWSATPVRCQALEVTADPASRAVTLE